MAVSARNQLKGEITEVVRDTIMAHITIQVGENLVESVITRRSADELNLKKGDSVTAVIKATEVLVSKP
jgi:molybdopterin-binding protein